MEADALIFTRLITPDMSYFNYLLRNEFLKDHCISSFQVFLLVVETCLDPSPPPVAALVSINHLLTLATCHQVIIISTGVNNRDTTEEEEDTCSSSTAVPQLQDTTLHRLHLNITSTLLKLTEDLSTGHQPVFR